MTKEVSNGTNAVIIKYIARESSWRLKFTSRSLSSENIKGGGY